MDPRHQTIEEATIDHIIDVINTHLFSDPAYLYQLNAAKKDEIRKICAAIYMFLQHDININDYLNQTDEDIVRFPKIEEIDFNPYQEKKNINALTDTIKNLLDQMKKTNTWQKDILSVIDEYHRAVDEAKPKSRKP